MPEDLSAINPSVVEDLAALAEAQVGIVYAGIGVPQVAATEDPPELDGINDPWFPYNVGADFFWSPVYEVSWLAGDEIPSLTTTFKTPDGESFFIVIDNPEVSWDIYANENNVESVASCVAGVITFTADGTGLLGLRVETAATEPADPAADVSLLFGDLTVVGPHTFPAATPAVALFGDDGTWYMDCTTPESPTMYGPKTAGEWGDGTAIG